MPGSSAPLLSPHPLSLQPTGPNDEDPQAILDDHLSRVLKTPGCQSPSTVARHRSPEHRTLSRGGPCLKPLVTPGASGPSGTSSLGGFSVGFTPGRALSLGRPSSSTKHIHHHYIHHHTATGPKSKEQIEAEAAQCIQCLCPPGGADYSDFTPGSVHIQYHLYWGSFTIHIKYTTFTLELCWGQFTYTSHTTKFTLGLYLGQ